MINDQESNFTRAMLAGLFVGIVDTVICLTYNIGYRDMTGYTPSELINVSSLIFGVNLLLLVVGLLYAAFIRYMGKRDMVFVVLFLLVTVFFGWKTEGVHRFADEIVNKEFKGLLLGVVLIMGVSAALLPVMYHSKFFDKYVV